jgi:T5SS/PEP-CTERM-associated repeat protein
MAAFLASRRSVVATAIAMRTALFTLAIFLYIASPLPAAISTTGNVTPDPATTPNIGTFYVGQTADATMLVDGGSAVTSGSSTIAYGAGTTASATITGNNSTWSATGLRIGQSGHGQLLIANGADVSSTSSSIGYSTGGEGLVTVTGSGSTWSTEGLTIADNGSGTLIVSNGGTLISSSTLPYDIDIGRLSGVGSATITGAGSSWTTNLSLRIGYQETGTLVIADGAVVSTTEFCTIGHSSGGVGTVSISDTTSAFNVGRYLAVGNSGTGVLNITNAQVDVADETYVGQGVGSNGNIHFDNGILFTDGLIARAGGLTGIGTINTHGWVSDQNLIFDQSHGLQQQFVISNNPGDRVEINLDVNGAAALGAGYNGQGTLTIADGMQVSSTVGYLGFNPQANGIATVRGPGTKWSIGGNLYVGRSGTATLNIENGGVVEAGTTSVDGLNATASILFNNGTLSTGTLWTTPAQLLGTGVVNTHGLIRRSH